MKILFVYLNVLFKTRLFYFNCEHILFVYIVNKNKQKFLGFYKKNSWILKIHNPIVSDSHSCRFRFTILLFQIHIPVVSGTQSCCFRFTIQLFPIYNPVVSDSQSCCFRFSPTKHDSSKTTSQSSSISEIICGIQSSTGF